MQDPSSTKASKDNTIHMSEGANREFILTEHAPKAALKRSGCRLSENAVEFSITDRVSDKAAPL